MKSEILMMGIIFLPIILSVGIYAFNNKKTNYLVFVCQFIMTILCAIISYRVISYENMSYVLGGFPKIIGIELYVDYSSVLFMAMSIIIWWVVFIYSWNQRSNDSKFMFFMLFLEGSLMALVQCYDFFTLFVLIELITILSAILIIYKKDGMSVKAGLYYLLFNGFGMMIYLIGLAFLYYQIGTLNISLAKVYLQNYTISSGVDYVSIAFACFFVAMCVKAALFPVYEWLPRAHTAAPAYISALLSGLLVKTGIFGLIRILDVFSNMHIMPTIFYLGFFTAIAGILFAISQKDIKGILAFHTISQIGLIMMSLAMDNNIGRFGAYLHLFNHFLFKSLLFLCAGLLINRYGTRKINEIKGALKTYPLLSIMMIIGILSISGAPFFIGHVSKAYMKASIENTYQYYMFQLINFGTILSFVKFSMIFKGRKQIKYKQAKGPMVATGILASIILIAYVGEVYYLNNIVKYWLGYSLKLDLTKLLIDYIQYGLMIGFAYVIYIKYIKSGHKVLYKLRHFQMRFQDAVISVIAFLLFVMYVI